MKLGILFSGGKDSAAALFWAQQQHEPVCLITIDSENKDSYMFHTDKVQEIPNIAKRIGLPLIFKKTKGEKETELNDLKSAILEAKNKFKIEGVVSGALASEYQRQRVDVICQDLGLASFAPLWHKDPEQYVRELIDLGFKIKIVRVAAEGLDESWVGKYIDNKFFNKLLELNQKYSVHIAGEGGEYESFVEDGPIFSSK
ncbi:diphthine--ammonia ligase [Candidatus Woesearchaeota archaeon]|jgi:diphthine-ammonia ligase|nr:diphthine--ammonia ligase [Candidatus Woesearchaeota archaeon]MBT7063008.1 diphthine--ammonia ligase [Candidatus Woesearchaeota archaeon]MBT7402591.1 diphthine--ammonia ligase [Candidatus Woesearchaeota archaeon]